MDALFLDASSLQAVIEWVGQYAAFGIGFGAVCWLLGYVVWFVIDVVRGV